MTRIEEREGLSADGQLRLIHADLDRLESRITKLYAAVVVAATGLMTSTVLLLIQGAVK